MPRPAVLLAAALALVALAYANALKAPFVWDDYVLIVHQPFVHRLQPLSAYFIDHSFWQSPQSSDRLPYYRPLVTLSYGLDYALWGPRAAGFHLTNLLLHLAVCALVFALCRRGGASPLAAASATALFGTLPRLTESVTFISGRTDVIAGVGALGALWLHRSEPRRTGARLLAATVLLMGLLAKEVAVAGFVALVALEAIPVLRRTASWRRSARNLAPASSVTAFYLSLHFLLAPPGGAFEQPPLGVRLLLPFQTLGRYLAMLLDPFQPRIRIGVVGVVEPWVAALGGLAAIGLAGLGLKLVRGRVGALPIAALVLASGALGLVLHALPIPVPVIAADRFLYVPAAGLAVAGAIGASRLEPRARKVAAVAAACLLVSFITATQLRNRDWADSLRLWRTAVQREAPDDPLPQEELGGVLLDLHRPAEALSHLHEALAIYRERAREHPWMDGVPAGIMGNLAITWAELGRADKARRILESLVRKAPSTPLYHVNLAVLDAREFRFGEAKRELRQALRLEPGLPSAAMLLTQVRKAESTWRKLPPERPDEPLSVAVARAGVYRRLGLVHAAETIWTRVAEDPKASPEDVRRAALFLTARGDPAVAKHAIERLARLSPTSPEPALLTRVLDARRRRTDPGAPPSPRSP